MAFSLDELIVLDPMLTAFLACRSAYAVPNYGTMCGKQYVPELRGMFSAAVADSMRRSRQDATMCRAADAGRSMSGSDPHGKGTAMASSNTAAAQRCGVAVPEAVPRPVTVLDVSSEVVAKPLQV